MNGVKTGEAYKWPSGFPVSPTAMALATFLLFLSSASAQIVYDIVSPRFFSASVARVKR